MIYKHEIKGSLEGFVSLEMPKYLERIEIMKSLSFETKDGEVESAKRVEPAIKLYAMLEKHVREVSLKHGELEIKSLDDLGYYQDGVKVINELGAVLIGGVRLGKN